MLISELNACFCTCFPAVLNSYNKIMMNAWRTFEILNYILPFCRPSVKGIFFHCLHISILQSYILKIRFILRGVL